MSLILDMNNKMGYMYSPDNDYAGNNNKKITSEMLSNMHPYMQDKSVYQSRWGSDLKFNWKNTSKFSNGSEF